MRQTKGKYQERQKHKKDPTTERKEAKAESNEVTVARSANEEKLKKDVVGQKLRTKERNK